MPADWYASLAASTSRSSAPLSQCSPKGVQPMPTMATRSLMPLLAMRDPSRQDELLATACPLVAWSAQPSHHRWVGRWRPANLKRSRDHLIIRIMRAAAPPWLGRVDDLSDTARYTAMTPDERLECFVQVCDLARTILQGGPDRARALAEQEPMPPAASRRWRPKDIADLGRLLDIQKPTFDAAFVRRWL